MLAKINTHIAFRCPDCLSSIYGFVGKFALSANLLRLKCSCGNSALDINITNDKKIRVSVPCVFCKQNHNLLIHYLSYDIVPTRPDFHRRDVI